MTKLEQIFKLMEHGYTKDEITNLLSDPEPEAPASDPKPEPEPDEPTAPEPKADDQSDTVARLIEQNNKLLEQLKEAQSKNVANAEGGKEPQPKGAASVIESFIKSL